MVRTQQQDVVAILVAVLALVPAAFGLSGCAEQERIAPAVPLAGSPVDVETLKAQITSQNQQWSNLEASCSLVVQSPLIQLPNNQVSFQNGLLRIAKSGKIELVAPKSGRRVVLTGDGERFRVELPVFGTGSGYEGEYDKPIGARPRNILLRPDDMVQAWDWSRLFAQKAQVVQHSTAISVLQSLSYVTEPEARLFLVNSLAYDRRRQLPLTLDLFAQDGSVRTQIRFGAWQSFQGSGGHAVQLPTMIWMSHPETQTSVVLRLANVALNVALPEASFQL